MIFPMLMAGLLVVSCSKKEKAMTEEISTEQILGYENIFSGEFEGTFPCADCSGIETKLTLNEEDKTFVLEQEYSEKDDSEFTQKGNFEISEDGECIILKDESVPTPQIFHITKDAAYQVESVEHKELREEYKLTRK